MTTEMICIGDELLEGRVSDANGAHLGSLLRDRLSRIQTVSDDIDDILAALEATTADVVVVSGGLGPTEDDRTRDAAARFFGEDLVSDEESETRIRARFEARGRPFTDNNLRQTLFPSSAQVLPSEVGTAPGFRIESGGRSFYFFPGVPREFAWFAETYVELGDHEDDQSLVLSFFGVGESSLETTISAVVEGAAAQNAKVGFCARFPVIEVKLTGPEGWISAAKGEVVEALGAYWIGEGDEGLSGRLGQALKARGETVTTAESCTAGGIAAMITDVPGSSAWFDRAYVTYANAAKVEELGVEQSALDSVGAVSEAVVRQMAEGARQRSGATYALAVSGIAGPGGGTAEKPVGTVHFALCTPGDTIHRLEVFHGRSRAAVRTLTAYTALKMLLDQIGPKSA